MYCNYNHSRDLKSNWKAGTKRSLIGKSKYLSARGKGLGLGLVRDRVREGEGLGLVCVLPHGQTTGGGKPAASDRQTQVRCLSACLPVLFRLLVLSCLLCSVCRVYDKTETQRQVDRTGIHDKTRKDEERRSTDRSYKIDQESTRRVSKQGMT
jgi:hypothetical protein